MKKADRQSRARERAARIEKHKLQEATMRQFLDECRLAMPSEDWTAYYQEAKRFAGETFHIVEHLVYTLGAIQLPINPRLRKAIDAVLEVCEIERDRWSDLRDLNYDPYWKSKYGYGQNTDK
jgi:hypothetical protein